MKPDLKIVTENFRKEQKERKKACVSEILGLAKSGLHQIIDQDLDMGKGVFECIAIALMVIKADVEQQIKEAK